MSSYFIDAKAINFTNFREQLLYYYFFFSYQKFDNMCSV